MFYRKSKLFVSEEAWKQRGNFESDDFHDHRVVRTSKTVVVMAPFSWSSECFAKSIPRSPIENEDIIVFPKPIHMPHFETASNGTAGFGPSADNPNAIGTVRLWLHLDKSDPHLSLYFAQAHFKTKRPGVNISALPRAIATYYGGWRKRALTEAVKLAIHVNLPLRIEWKKLYVRNYSGVSPLHRELLEVASSLGVNAREVRSNNGRFLVINPVKR